MSYLIIPLGSCSGPFYRTVSHHFSHLLSYHAQHYCLGSSQWCWTGACFSAPGPNFLFTLPSGPPQSGLLKKACSASQKALLLSPHWSTLMGATVMLTEPLLGQSGPPPPSDDWIKFTSRTLVLREGKRKFGKGESSTDAHYSIKQYLEHYFWIYKMSWKCC